MSAKLYVGNLTFQTSSDDLRDLFSKAGTVESANVVEDRETGRSRGFGFVEMSTSEEAATAIDQLNGKDHEGRNLTVNEAKPREDRGGGGGNRGGGGGSRW
jgi:cold-inducible RNA-binding protein